LIYQALQLSTSNIEPEFFYWQKKFINYYQPFYQELFSAFILVDKNNAIKIYHLLKKFTPIFNSYAEHLQCLKEYDYVNKPGHKNNSEFNTNLVNISLQLFLQVFNIYRTFSFYDKKDIMLRDHNTKTKYSNLRNINYSTLLLICFGIFNTYYFQYFKLLNYVSWIIIAINMFLVHQFDVQYQFNDAKTTIEDNFIKQQLSLLRDKYPETLVPK